jgi:hypothetical protein
MSIPTGLDLYSQRKLASVKGVAAKLKEAIRKVATPVPYAKNLLKRMGPLTAEKASDSSRGSRPEIILQLIQIDTRSISFLSPLSLLSRSCARRRVERQYGSFTRSFTLPSSVDTGEVSANYEKGLLKIKLAKKAEAKPKQIKVNVGSEKTLEAKVHGKAA